MPTRKEITTRKQALAEGKRLGLPIPETLEEMIPVAAEYGILEEQSRSGFEAKDEGYARALKSLQAGDLNAYLEFMGENRIVNDWEKEREWLENLHPIPWGFLRFRLLSFGMSSSLYNLYYNGLALNWLSENAKQIHTDIAEIALEKGITLNLFPMEQSANSIDIIRHNYNEIVRAEAQLLEEHGIYSHPLTETQWSMPEMVPDWVRFILGITVSASSGGRRAAPSRLAQRGLLGMSTAFPLAHGITAMNQRLTWKSIQQGAATYESGYLVSLKSEAVHIVYFLGEMEFEDDLYPQPLGAAQTTEILKRWGVVHSKLYAGLCVLLGESHGRGVEVGEKDLLFISGLQVSVEKGHMRKAVAIEKIQRALKDLNTLSAAVRSTNRRVETDRQPLFVTQPIVLSKNGEAVSIAAHIAPGHWIKKYFGYEYPNFDIPRELFTLPPGLPSSLGIWLSANVWRFDKGRKVPLRDVLEAAIPRMKPEHPEEWEGHSITWEDLEPTERTPKTTARMKECRKALREQLSRAEKQLAAHNFIFEIHGNKRTGTSWENFLNSLTSVSIVGVESRRPLLDRVLEAEKAGGRLTGEAIKAALKALGMKQGELAKALEISPAVVTRWLKPENDSAHRPISPKHEPRIRALLKID